MVTNKRKLDIPPLVEPATRCHRETHCGLAWSGGISWIDVARFGRGARAACLLILTCGRTYKDRERTVLGWEFA